MQKLGLLNNVPSSYLTNDQQRFVLQYTNQNISICLTILRYTGIYDFTIVELKLKMCQVILNRKYHLITDII